MPKGNGTTFHHQKLKKICKDYIELQDIGDVIDLIDFTKYLSTIPISQFCRKPTRDVVSNSRLKWTTLVRSANYYNTVLGRLDNVKRITVTGLSKIVKVNEDAQLKCWICSKTYDVRKRYSSVIDVYTCSEKCATYYVNLTTPNIALSLDY